MNLEELTALCPLDGRYHKQVASFTQYFSEYALIKYRIKVEIEYFIALHNHPETPQAPLTDEICFLARKIYTDFNPTEALQVKEIERTTNHDVKAVEYYLKEKLRPHIVDHDAQIEMIHFGLTSQDVNNTAIPMMLRDALKSIFLPRLTQLVNQLFEMATEWKGVAMLGHTHGQAATPTTMGKEIKVFAQRLLNQLMELESLPYPAKFGGATGNLNAHYIAFPKVDWNRFADDFVGDNLGLSRSFPTTQIEHYDGLARIFDCIRRINTILIDFCQDIWLYVSMDYFKQHVVAGEVGSSAMPHKVNPIDFENAEGNCGLSSALLEFMSRKLPISRLQRDLTDSTILRNLGISIAYSYLAQSSVLKGIHKLQLNVHALNQDLQANWAVLAEAIQTILRRESYPDAYEALKALTRGNEGINSSTLQAFIRDLDVTESVKEELLALRPETYLGNANH